MSKRLTTNLLSILCLVFVALPVSAQSGGAPLTRHVPARVLTGEAQIVGRLPATQSMRLVLVLPLSNQAGLDSFLQQRYDPSSPFYRQFLTVDQFTSMFGPSQEDYNHVIGFAEANGFTVVGTSRNRLNIDVTAPVATIEQAFQLTMNVYRDMTQNRTFYAPDREPAPNAGVQLWHIAGLENYSMPRPSFRRKTAGTLSNATTGSGPSSAFLGSDMRAAYYGGTLTGAGQSLGLLEYYGTDLADLRTYFKNVGQTNKVPITLLSTDGTSTSCLASAGCDDTEQTIDMTQALGMAPGLSSLVMYVGSSDAAIFNAMATANPLNAQLSSSWTWSPADPNTDKPYFQEFAAQGQNLFQAAGDSDAWGPGSEIFPADDVYVTSVGGTDLQTSGSGGTWSSETAWVYGGGGISPNHFAIPSWQTSVASGCSSCSGTYRNGPDVSANANFTFYVCADQTTCTANEYGGTSFAAPMWAGYMALVNEQAVANSGRPRGFINPTLYAIGSGASYDSDFHDITSGSNGDSATIGYDLATGWGSPNGSGLLNALIVPPNFAVSAAPASQSVVQGTNTSYTVNVIPAGGFGSTVTLSISGVPSGASAIFSSNTVAGGGAPTLSVTTGTAALGTYTLTISGSGGGINQTTSVTLAIIPPPMSVSVAPHAATVAPGQTQQFTATVLHTNNTGVTWTLSPNTGTVSPAGLYTPPSTVSTEQTVIVTATSVADMTKSASANITLIPPGAWYSLSWSQRTTITINATQVSGTSNLVNFPVLVSLTDANLRTVANGGNVGKPDGSDILFTASDGATKLAHEIETYNGSTGQLIAWVQVPTVSPGINTIFYLYYGNSTAANQQNAAGVWDSNFEGVWHLPNGTTLTANDSTGNGNNTGALNGSTAGSGEIDGAASLNGSSNYIEVASSGSLNGWTQQTVSMWIKAATDMTDNARLMEKGANNEWTLAFNYGAGNQELTLQNLGTNSPAITTSVAVADNTWHKIDATIDNGSKALAIYVDGVLNVSGSSASAATSTNNNLFIGEYGAGGYYYHGLIDEVEISNTVRSAAWIATRYNNQSSPSTFLSEGAQQNSGAVAAPAFSPAAGAYASAQSVTISTTTPGASIRYTTDGSTPSETQGTLYSGAVTVSATTTLNAIAYESGLMDSVVATATYTITGSSWYNTTWSNRKALTINATQVSGTSNLVNFPVLVSVTDANLRTVANGGNVGKPDGSDILFTASDGATKLAHEIETYNGSTGQLIAWVQVPTVSAGINTIFYLYYGNSTAANQQNAAGVWDSNFEGVWHLPNGTTLTANDSTGNGNNTTALNGSTAGSGEIDGAASLNGSSNFIEVASSGSLNGWTQQTVSMWIKAQTDMTYNARLIEKGANNEWTLAFNYGAGNQELTLQNLGTNSPAITTSVAVADNTWHKIDATIDNGSKALAIYVDGVLNVSGSSASAASSTNNNLFIGEYGAGGYYYHGLIDEVEISNTVRSAAWIATRYNNQSAPSTFLSEGAQQNSGAVAAPAFSPAAGAYASAQSVTISTTTPGASIRYTTDGSTPSETQGTLYSGAVTVSATTTLNAIAYESGLMDSVVATATYTITGSSWYNTTWSNRKALTINATQVSGTSNLVNFPVLVSVTDANLRTVANGGNVGKPDGSDILFTASDGATKLAHEIETYNGSTGQLIAWVQVPTVSAGINTIFYLYYGNSTAANQQNAAGVWDSNFEGVWHLPNGTTLTANDSTGNGNNTTALNGSTAGSGEIDGAASLNGSSNFIEVASSGSLNGWTQQTVSMWIKAATDMTYNARLMEKGANNEWTLAFNYGAANQELTLQNLGTNSPAITTSVAVADNTWHKIDATIDNGSKALAIYVDGVLNVSGSSASAASSTNNNLFIGEYGAGGYYYHGLIDEVEISNTVRSAAWIATRYNNQSAPSTFLSEGAQQNSGAVAAPAFSPAAGAYASAQSVTISTTTPGASIRYTTDGSTPSETQGTLYSGAVTVSATTTLNAIAYESGLMDSVVATATYTITGSSWYNTTWSNRKALTINATQVSGTSNLVNFPVLVSVTDANLRTVANGGNVGKPDGSDILFTASDGATKLAHEIETYNGSTGQLIAWVQVPTVSAGINTIFYLYYGNSTAANQQNAAGVWDSNFEGVWHLPNGTTLTANDSTGNGNNTTALNGSTAGSGEIDGAASLNGSSNFIEVASSGSLNGWTQQTVSMWIKAATDMTDNARLMEKGANNEWTLAFNYGAGNQELTLQNLGTNSPAITTSVAVADNTWHKIDATIDNGSKALAIYVDGMLNVSGSSASAASSTNNNLFIGEYGAGGYYYHGLIDEVEISNTVRSAAWIATRYNNQSSSSTFLSEGAQQNAP